jgi:hypothetical protein
MRRILFSGILTTILLRPVCASILGDAAAVLSARSFVKLSANASLQNFNLDESLFYWNDSAVWNPLSKRIEIGGGNTSEKVHYRLNEDLTLTKLEDAPFPLDNGVALHSCDPVSGRFIVTSHGDGAWWEYNILDDSWKKLAGLSNAPNFTVDPGVANQHFQVPLPHLGVILYMDSGRNVYLYKHTAAGTPPPLTLAERPRRLRVR